MNVSKIQGRLKALLSDGLFMTDMVHTSMLALGMGEAWSNRFIHHGYSQLKCHDLLRGNLDADVSQFADHDRYHENGGHNRKGNA